MARKILTEQQIQNLIKDYQAGMSPKEIGVKNNIYDNSVCRILRKRNVDRTQHHKPLNDLQKQYICNRYKLGFNSEEIAKEIGYEATAILRILKENNVIIRPDSENKRKYDINENFFEVIDTEEKAYFLGFIYADGNVSKRGSAMKIGHSKDTEILKKLSILIYNKEIIKYNEKTSVLYFYSKKMKEDLIKLGCMPAKSFLIRLPNLRLDLMKHFIRGYFDGDGCISINKKNKGTIDITSNINFIDDLVLFFKEKEKKIVNRYIRKKNKNTGFLQSKKQEIINFFYHYFYDNATIFMKRKKDKFDILNLK